MRVLSKKLLNDDIDLKTLEEKKAYLKGTFLACGSISDPKTSGYHMEFVFNSKKTSDFISNIFHEFSVNSSVKKTPVLILRHILQKITSLFLSL